MAEKHQQRSLGKLLNPSMREMLIGGMCVDTRSIRLYRLWVLLSNVQKEEQYPMVLS